MGMLPDPVSPTHSGPMSPLSPLSPFSPVKSAVKSYFSGAAPPARRVFCVSVRPKETRQILTVPLSPKSVMRNKQEALKYFRGARAANQKFTEYKENEDEKRRMYAAAAVPSMSIGMQKLRVAQRKLRSMRILAGGRMGGIGPGSHGSMTGNNNFLERMTVKRTSAQAKKLAADSGVKMVKPAMTPQSSPSKTPVKA